MAVEMTELSKLPPETQVRILEEMQRVAFGEKLVFKQIEEDDMSNIEIDGLVYIIPEPVNRLIDDLCSKIRQLSPE
jgi:hypothetical protein